MVLFLVVQELLQNVVWVTSKIITSAGSTRLASWGLRVVSCTLATVQWYGGHGLIPHNEISTEKREEQ